MPPKLPSMNRILDDVAKRAYQQGLRRGVELALEQGPLMCSQGVTAEKAAPSAPSAVSPAQVTQQVTQSPRETGPATTSTKDSPTDYKAGLAAAILRFEQRQERPRGRG